MDETKPFLAKIFKAKRLIIIFAVIGILAIFSFGFFKDRGQEVQVQTAKVERNTIVSSVSASGTVIASNFFPVTTSASGVVKKVYVKDGDSVTKGQKIAEIDLDPAGLRNYAQAYSNWTSASNSLASAKNNLRLAEATLAVVYDEIKGHDTDESLTMKEKRTKAEVAKDNAYLQVVSAQASLESSYLSYRESSPVIYSPVSGIIENVTAVEGMLLEVDSSPRRIAVVEVVGGSPLASFNVSEVDIVKIKRGQKATVTIDSLEGKTFAGEVVSVDRIGKTSNGVTNYPVIVRFDAKMSGISPNMSASANIILEVKENVLTIPSSMVSASGDQDVVRVIRDGKEQVVTVELGLASDTSVEVLSGLGEGETVVMGEGSPDVTNKSNRRSIFSSPGGFSGGAVFKMR
jgi:macrolide-specific efflux system membrane fusion protein